ncbi:hypothetical protein CCHR01_17752 [Colletotrichum chrysophilum]|uniref:Uncharacterized protein n=1 Tax=Colletotrichum chrysophilum TaxID=1836956 RepID=A0AAD9E9K4_9PEZI|nr:hypothetical protein CCHR01_17752 [Colletotrichum chrysophilum]
MGVNAAEEFVKVKDIYVSCMDTRIGVVCLACGLVTRLIDLRELGGLCILEQRGAYDGLAASIRLSKQMMVLFASGDR